MTVGRVATVLVVGTICAVTAVRVDARAERTAVAAPQDRVDTRLEREAYERVNAYRRSVGLGALTWSEDVAAIARAHSETMARGETEFGHDGIEARRDAVGRRVQWSAIAENVARNDYPTDSTALVAVRGWIRSPSHRENMEGRYRVTGMGVAHDATGLYYFTQIFVRPR